MKKGTKLAVGISAAVLTVAALRAMARSGRHCYSHRSHNCCGSRKSQRGDEATGEKQDATREGNPSMAQ